MDPKMKTENQIITEKYALYNGDCVSVMKDRSEEHTSELQSH